MPLLYRQLKKAGKGPETRSVTPLPLDKQVKTVRDSSSRAIRGANFSVLEKNAGLPPRNPARSGDVGTAIVRQVIQRQNSIRKLTWPWRLLICEPCWVTCPKVPSLALVSGPLNCER